MSFKISHTELEMLGRQHSLEASVASLSIWLRKENPDCENRRNATLDALRDKHISEVQGR